MSVRVVNAEVVRRPSARMAAHVTRRSASSETGRAYGPTVVGVAPSKPRDSTVKRLYALSMNQCAYPNCPTKLVTETGTVVGEVCHIRAHNSGGPRYDSTQTDEDRHGFDNLILMCGVHHTEIDAADKVEHYTAEWLLATKRAHEDRARASGEIDAPASIVAALLLTATVYEAGATHMDFRNAVFKVGGEGGRPGGSGGSGGSLTIVGIASLPADIERQLKLDLDGGPGQWPGAAGGGAGTLVFEGRPATAADISLGLAVPLFFPVNAGQVAEGLLYILGAGWDHMWVTQTPIRVPINVAFTAEFGSIDANTLIGFELTVTDHSGVERGRGSADVVVPATAGAIKRNSGVASFDLAVESAGLYELSMLSGGTQFARYLFEVRIR